MIFFVLCVFHMCSVYCIFVCLCCFCYWPPGCWLSRLIKENLIITTIIIIISGVGVGDNGYTWLNYIFAFMQTSWCVLVREAVTKVVHVDCYKFIPWLRRQETSSQIWTSTPNWRAWYPVTISYLKKALTKPVLKCRVENYLYIQI
jgi:hypothetical protein